MRITKYIHSCLLVETDDRVALFDPGNFSAAAVPVDSLERLDDIFITHSHPDHCDPSLLRRLIDRFPSVRITSNPEVVALLAEQNIVASTDLPAGVTLFDAPHEGFAPLMPTPPPQFGFHYLDQLSHPGDSHSFTETRAVLALPMTAPWGTMMRAAQLAVELRPRYVVPIHDWHWRDEALAIFYERFADVFAAQGIEFVPLQTGQSFEVS